MGTYAEAIEFMKNAEGGEEHASAVLAEVQKKGGGESAARKRAGEIEAKLNSITEALKAAQIDPDADLSEQLSKIGKSADTSKVDILERQLKTMQKSLEEKEARAAQLEKANKRERLFNALSADFDKRTVAKSLGLNYLLDNGTIEMGADGKPVYKRGDEIVSGDVVAEFLKDNPEYARNNQNPGGGAAANIGGGQNQKSMPRAQFEQMGLKARAQYVADGGTVFEKE